MRWKYLTPGLLFSGGLFFISQSHTANSCVVEARTLEDGDFKIQISHYFTGDTKNPAVIVIPPTGGANILDRSYATALCRNKINAVILEHWSGEDEKGFDLKIHQRFYDRAQRAVKNTIKFMDSPFVGVLGTSVGALHGAMAAGVHEQVRAAFLIVGGAPISSIIARSDQGAMLEAKEKRFEMFKFKTVEEYESALYEAIDYEPKKLSAAYKGKSFGIILSSADTTVPSKYQYQLRDLLKPTAYYEFSSSHFMSIVKSWFWHRTDMVQFFKNASEEQKN